ncbi:hypothetical protein [Micromonospora sp. HM134]|uniref:hypothetical protein n=1 Tax=Micromonospora sp. HM134 TaxID=2583243 RepID=UPI001F0D9EE6|nr:hypothetical protein [Micromonospora sp. HM134]
MLDRHGVVVGAGYHRRKGEPHAEVNALRAAGKDVPRRTYTNPRTQSDRNQRSISSSFSGAGTQ